MEELGDFLQEFPVLGFNSGKYDINLNQATPVFETSERLPSQIRRQENRPVHDVESPAVEISGHNKLPSAWV